MGIPCDGLASWFADQVGGILCGEDQHIHELVSLRFNQKGKLSFAFATALKTQFMGCLLVQEAIEGQCCIVVSDPKLSMGHLIQLLLPQKDPFISPLADIHPDAEVAESVTIHAGAVVGAGCRIGIGSEIHSNVVLYENTHIGARCQIHSGAVIGRPGFAYHHINGVPKHISHGAGVIIEDDVDIGANSCIDQGMLEPTYIGSHVKIDNLVHIGHNTYIESGTIIAAQVGVSGSAQIGRGVLLGGQVGISNHAKLEDGVQVAAKSGVHGILKAGKMYFGIPALPKNEAFALMRALRRLPRWMRKK